MLHSFLSQIKDHRRGQGKRYQLDHILLFAILAILSGATSYRKVQRFIVNRYEELDEVFNLQWKRMPAYTTIRDIIQATSGEEIEKSFREYSATLAAATKTTTQQFIGCDGKVLRGSFDHFVDVNAIQILSAFVTDGQLILAHVEVSEKTNEIPVAQQLMEKLGLSGYIFTLDALHCQKNARSS